MYLYCPCTPKLVGTPILSSSSLLWRSLASSCSLRQLQIELAEHNPMRIRKYYKNVSKSWSIAAPFLAVSNLSVKSGLSWSCLLILAAWHVQILWKLTSFKLQPFTCPLHDWLHWPLARKDLRKIQKQSLCTGGKSWSIRRRNPSLPRLLPQTHFILYFPLKAQSPQHPNKSKSCNACSNCCVQNEAKSQNKNTFTNMI